jgi:VWFA-related protein
VLLGLAAASVAVATLSAQQAPPPPQQPRTVFRSTVDLVAVEVQVVSRDGAPMPALGIKDFEVKIDGRTRQVVSADLVSFDPASMAARKLGAPTPFSNKPHDRIFVLAVDEASLRPSQTAPALQAARKFIDKLHTNDYIGLFTYPIFERNLDITHGHANVKLALSKVMGSHMHVRGEFDLLPSEIIDVNANDRDTYEQIVRRECDPSDIGCGDRIIQEARAAAGFAEAEAASRVHALRILLDALADVPGRKTLIVLSGGMFSSDRTVGRPDIASSMMQLGRDAAIANTAVYVFHLDDSFFQSMTSGSRLSVAEGDPPLFARSFRDGEVFGHGLQQLAGTAGGSYLRIQAGTPDYAFDRVLREMSAYYLLGVAPDDRERDGRLHFLRVKASVKGATVRSRTHVFIPRRR